LQIHGNKELKRLNKTIRVKTVKNKEQKLDKPDKTKQIRSLRSGLLARLEQGPGAFSDYAARRILLPAEVLTYPQGRSVLPELLLFVESGDFGRDYFRRGTLRNDVKLCTFLTAGSSVSETQALHYVLGE
jgi:hypothetical protein